MSEQHWTPCTLEDHLLQKYLAEYPGLLLLEVEVGGTDPVRGACRLDGDLIPGRPSRVEALSPSTRMALQAAVEGSADHVLEAKRYLNRNVIGQVEVGVALFERDFAPASALGVAVCAHGNADLEWYCANRGIEVALYSGPVRSHNYGDGPIGRGRSDLRSPPDHRRKQAFLCGRETAVQGRLFGSIRRRKTHANMGNLFGWIYGDVPVSFREAT